MPLQRNTRGSVEALDAERQMRSQPATKEIARKNSERTPCRDLKKKSRRKGLKKKESIKNKPGKKRGTNQ